MIKKYIAKFKKIIVEKKEFFLLLLIILTGLILRLINIGTEPYWSDEILSLEIAKYYLGNINGLWNYLQLVEVHPPLYYYLIQLWGSWFGFAEASIRSLSLIFSLATIYLTYYASIVLFQNKKIGLLASFFIAILPMQIEFGQEARPYAIYSFFGILSLILLIKYFKEKIYKKRLIYIIGFTLTSVIGLYLHYSYMLILIPLALYWLGVSINKKSSREFLWWLISMFIIFLGFYAWLPTLIFKSFLVNNIITTSPRVVYGNRPLLFFEYAFNNLIWLSKESPTVIEIIAIFLAKLILFFLLIKAILKNTAWFKKYKKSLIYLGTIFILSNILFLIFPSSAAYTDFLFKHIILDSIILAIFLAIIFIHVENVKWRIIFLVIFIISLLTFQVKILGDDSLFDVNYRFKIVVDYINERYQEGDLILVNTARIRPQLNYYLKSNLPEFIGIDPIDIIVTDFMATRETLGFRENESQLRISSASWPEINRKINYLIKKNNPKRIWVFGNDTKMTIRKWFILNKWNFGFKPIGRLFPLNLYMKKIEKND